MALGDLAFVETGKFAGIRALPDGKVEATYQGTGKLFGADYSSIYTGVATPHGGTLIAEFNGICTTKDGDTVGVWAHGRGRPTGSGLKASWRGGVIWQASSSKFARLNSLPGVWELDIDEGGNFHWFGNGSSYQTSKRPPYLRRVMFLIPITEKIML